MAVVNCPGPVHNRFLFSSFIFARSQKYFLRKLREMIELRRTFSRKRIECRIELKNKIRTKPNEDGTFLDQSCRLNNIIRLGFGKIDSRLSQNLSQKVKNCHNWESNSSRQNDSLAPNHYSQMGSYAVAIHFYFKYAIII